MITLDGSDNWFSAIGEHEIRCGDDHEQLVYEWTFELGLHMVSIGIVPAANVTSQSDLNGYVFGGQIDKIEVYYAMGNYGGLEFNDGRVGPPNARGISEYGKSMRPGDVVKMTFNTAERTLSFERNDEDFGVLYDNIKSEHSYVMAVTCYVRREEITGDEFVKLLSASIHY